MSNHRDFVLSPEWDRLFADQELQRKLEVLERWRDKTEPDKDESQLQHTYRLGMTKGQLEAFKWFRERLPSLFRGPVPAGTVLREMRQEGDGTASSPRDRTTFISSSSLH